MTRRAVAALALVVFVLSTACAREEPVDPVAELAARPSLEQTVTRYEEMQQRLRERLDTELGPFGWYQPREETRAGCGWDFADQAEGRVVHLAPWGFPDVIPDPDWPRAREIVVAVIAEYGFAPAGLEVDDPGHHLVNAVDTALGAHFTIGTRIHTSMGTTTGCHLPATAR